MPRINYASTFTDQRVKLETENLTSQINGSRQTFTISRPFFSTRLYVYYNGVRQQVGYNITIASDTTFTCDFTPETGDTLFVDYSPIYI